ncbi:helix-turn-helix transcriptional regulator [Mesonia sediminis]
MSKYIISRRIQYIMQFIRDRHYPSKETILEYLAQRDFEISARTLERDFEKIKTDFGLELCYNNHQQGYYIDTEKSVKADSFFKFLELLNLGDVFRDGLQNHHELLDYVVFDDSSQLKNIENLAPILQAFKLDCDLHFTYKKFSQEQSSQKHIRPLLLKEYLNRWYLIGVPQGKNQVRTYGVERMQNPRVGKLSTTPRSQYQDQLQKYDRVVGLFATDEQPQEIKLKVTNKHAQYLASLPLHHSQRILPATELGYQFVNLTLVPTHELDGQILKMSMYTEVIAPKSYRQHIQNEIEKIYKKYQDQ